MRGLRALVVAWVGACGGALAQSPADRLVSTLQACMAVPDASARLACYDTALQRKPEGPAASPRAPAASAAPVAPQAADFGLARPRPAEEVQVIETRISGRFEGWTAGTRFDLANGQVWEVIDASRAAYDIASPAVRVKRGVLGSFFIEIDGVAATPRVRRIK